MFRFIFGLLVGFGLAVMLLASPHANADPGGCNAGRAPFSHWSQCDYDWQPDGSHQHCDAVYVFGFGGWNCFYVPAQPL